MKNEQKQKKRIENVVLEETGKRFIQYCSGIKLTPELFKRPFSYYIIIY